MPPRAQSHFVELLERFPTSDYAENAAIARARYLDEANEYSSAAKVYQLILDRYSESSFAPTAMLRQAIMLKSTNGKTNLRRAQSLLIDYVQMQPQPRHLDEALYHLAGVYQKNGQFEKGLEKYRQITLKHLGSPFWADAAFRVAMTHSQRKEFDVAEKILFQILTNPTIRSAVREKAILLYGDVAVQSSKWDLLRTRMLALLEADSKPNAHPTSLQLPRKLSRPVSILVGRIQLSGRAIRKRASNV